MFIRGKEATMTLTAGRLSHLFFFIAFCVVTYMATKRFRETGKVPIRRINALDAFEEAIGRATELGRPVHYTLGRGLFDSEHGAQTFAGFAMLKHTAATAARFGCRLIVTNQSPQAHPVTEEIVRAAYVEAGQADAFNPDDIRYLSETQNAYVSGVIGVMEREKIAANIMIGYFYAESMMLAETANKVGAIQIAGTANSFQIPFFVAACDYSLIGEEIFAASAYLERQPVQIGSLVAQDFGKYLAVILIVLGTLFASMGQPFLANLLKK
jgi:hypothetical protein